MQKSMEYQIALLEAALKNFNRTSSSSFFIARFSVRVAGTVAQD